MDCIKLLPRVDWSPNAPSGSGIGVYILGGLLEVSDSVPYCDTPEVFFAVCLTAAASLAITLLIYYSVSRSNREE